MPEKSKESSPFSKAIARLLDDFIRIPGTDKRIGLDPLIGLIPGIGDSATALAGASLLVNGIRKGVPVSVFIRMGGNWALNSLIGAIPILGDAFSFWFKSNRRNHHLIKAHLESNASPGKTRKGWGGTIALVVILLLIVSVVIATIIGVLSLLWPD